LNVQEFAQLLRSQWLIICSTIVVGVLAAVALTLLTTPQYEASTRLFVSTTTVAKDPYAAYQGTLFTQQRVTSYTKLLMGDALAQRTVDKLHLDMGAATLQAEVKANSNDAALIDVSVRDPSPARARDIANALSDEFVVMVGELEASANDGRRDARVVVQQHASIPAKPVIPKTTRNLAIGLALGAFLGIGLAIIRDRLDKTVKDQQIVEKITGVGLIANIPLDADRQTDPAISFADDRSAMAEAFRKLRTNIQFFDVHHPPRIIVVSSSLPGEGRSTTAINIALALAEADHNVLLVDGDMRKPGLAEYFGLRGSAGFSTVLTGRASLHEVLQKTRYPGLSVLTSGPNQPNPSELLGSMVAKNVLNEMRSGFDYVIVDSSALLPVTDAAVLAAEADGVLVIARFAKTKREQLTHAVRNLRNVNARILGAVLTMKPERGNASYSKATTLTEKHRRSRVDSEHGAGRPGRPAASVVAKPR
jgi:capsular exopolysaccharide synthesis family protein